MTLPSTTNRWDYTGDGATSVYAYTKKIFTNTDLVVTVKDTSSPPVETTLTITTDYTVSGVGEITGGNVTLVNSSQAWLDGDGDLKSSYTITIRRVRPITQGTDIRNQGAYFPEAIENEFDKQIMIDQQQQEQIDRSLKLPTSLAAASFDPTLPTDITTANIAIITNSDGDGFTSGPTADEISNAQTYATNASASATLASQWATLTSGQVASTDYSAKAWAIGGTGVTDTASRGAAKEWAIETASTVDGTSYSSKEHAIGTQTRGASGGGSAKDWATYTSGTVDDTSYSSKEYASGSQASTGGSSKNWATQTGSDVTGGSSGDMSSKEWAIGALGRGVSGEGSSKDWATYTSSTVDDTSYSAKEHAIGTQAGAGGSAKEWATRAEDSAVPGGGGEFSAKHYSAKASASATAAAASATSLSLPTISGGDAGKMLKVKEAEDGYEFTSPIDNFTLVDDGTNIKVVDRIEQNIMLNAFRLAVVGSLSLQGMVDGFTDEYEDESGVDTGASTNQSYDASNDLYSPGPVSIAEATTEDGNVQLGDQTDVEYRPAQSFTISGGSKKITAVDIYFSANVGSPSGDVSVRIETNSSDKPTGILANANLTKTITPTPSALNTFTFTTPSSLPDGTYWIVLGVANQSTDNRYTIEREIGMSGGGYTGGFATRWNSSAGDYVDPWSGAGDLKFTLYGVGNMTLISETQTAESEPDTARIIMFEEDVDSVTVNTDIKAYASRDDGSTWSQITLSDEGDYDSGRRVLSGVVDISGQPSGVSMRYKIETDNNKDCKEHGTSLTWA